MASCGRRLAISLFVCVAWSRSVGAAAPMEESPVVIEHDHVPLSVRRALTCNDDPASTMLRYRFGGGFIFTQRCPGNNQNYRQSFVYALDREGLQAEALLFPSVAGSQLVTDTELSNARIFDDTNTIGEILVNDEHEQDSPCRFETLWRLTGQALMPVFHRSAQDCEANASTKWDILLDRRSDAERSDRW